MGDALQVVRDFLTFERMLDAIQYLSAAVDDLNDAEFGEMATILIRRLTGGGLERRHAAAEAFAREQPEEAARRERARRDPQPHRFGGGPEPASARDMSREGVES